MPCFACKTGLKQIRIRMFFSNVSSNRHCKILRDKIIFCTILFLVWSGQHQTVKRSGKLLTCILNVYPFLIWFPTFMPFLKFVNCYLTANQGYFFSGFVNLSLQISSGTVFGSIDDHTIEDEVNNASKKQKPMQNIRQKIVSRSQNMAVRMVPLLLFSNFKIIIECWMKAQYASFEKKYEYEREEKAILCRFPKKPK